MALIINQSQSEVYIGQYKVDTAAVAPGQVVVSNESTGTVATPITDTIADGKDLFIVANYDSYADTDMTNSKDFTVAVGKYARLKKLMKGDEFTTDQFIGTYASINVGDIFAVNGTAGSGTTGKWIAIGARTPELQAKVVEKVTIYGSNEALKFRVI